MQRRLPKIGFRSPIAKDTAEVLLYALDKLPAGEIDFAALRAAAGSELPRRPRSSSRASDQGVHPEGYCCHGGCQAAIEAAAAA